jgi:23S rRNA-/tRNA-specific pseudouridylate synthase
MYFQRLKEIFDPPIPVPPSGPPPFGSLDPVRLGQIPTDLLGEPAWVLVSRLLPTLDQSQASELVEFGALWLDNHVFPEPLGKLNGLNFRLNLPAYKPQVYYEIDPKRLIVNDGDILIYDKESGPPTLPVPHDCKNNLQAALERYTGLTLRAPHRLDAATSGLVIFAANRLAAGRLGQAFQ